MEVLGYTTTETLLWDYSEVEEYHVLVRPPARPRRTLYIVPWWYAYHWFHLFGGTDLRIVYYPFKNVHFGDVPEPVCDAEILEVVASITVSPSSVDENGGIDLIFTITLDSASAFDTEITYSVSGTASIGDDYTASFLNPITILAGQTTATITVTPVDDALDEDDETVIVTLFSGTSGTNIVTISPTNASATGTIVSEDIVIPTVTWDPPTAVNVALSNGNLTATNEGIEGIQGVQATVSFDTGKYYFEVTATGGPVTPTFPFTKYNLGIGSPGGIPLYSFLASRWIYGAGLEGAGVASANGSDSPLGGSALNESIVTGDVIGIAVDLDNNRLWFRSVAGPSYPNPLNWNGSSDWGGSPGVGADNDPATSVGGMVVPAGTMAGSMTPTAIFNDDNLTESMTFNFGDSAFSGEVPFGYTAGWGTPSAGSSSDPYWTSVVFLCGFNDSSCDESTTNNKGDGGVATTVFGGYGFNHTVRRFGTASAFIRLNGIRWADSPDWNFDGNFTIEISYYTVSVAVGTATVISQWTTTGSQQSWRIVQVGATIRWEVSTTGANTFTDLTSGTILANTYYDIMVDYDGTKYRLYLNGSMVASSSTARVIFNSTSMMSIGSNPTGGANTGDNVFPDEARITKGVARCGSDGGYTVVGPFPRYVYATSGTTFDPATANKVILSNGNLTVTNAQVVVPEQIVSIPLIYAKSSGKYYYEITLQLEDNNGNSVVSFGLTTATYTGLVIDGGKDGIIAYESGNLFANEIFETPRICVGGGSFGGIDSGDIIGIAVDFDHGNVWVNVVGGPNVGLYTWNGANLGDLKENPSTNSGGVFLLAGSAFVPFATFTGDEAVGVNSETANFGATPFVGPVPTGFTSGWPISGGNTPVTLNTWDPTTALGLTLSNGNLTATSLGLAGDQIVKSLVRKTFGKFYFEITINHVNLASTNFCFGVAATNTSYTSILGGTDMGQVFCLLSGVIKQNGGLAGRTIGTLHDNDVIGVAVNLIDNFDGFCWFKVVAGPDAAGANWNGSASSNPVTGSIGVYIDTNTLTPFLIFGGTDATEQMTANFGATAFSGTVPSGFTAGWPA